LTKTRPQTGANTVRVWSTNKAPIFKDMTNYKANMFGFYAPAGKSVLGFMKILKHKVCAAF